MEGLDKFRDAFRDFSDNYVIIGGTACEIAMSRTEVKARAYLNLLNEKAVGRYVNTKDIKKHRSDVLKNVVILPDEEIQAPEAIVNCIHEFVGSIRKDWTELADPLAKSIDQNEAFVEALLELLNERFINQQ